MRGKQKDERLRCRVGCRKLDARAEPTTERTNKAIRAKLDGDLTPNAMKRLQCNRNQRRVRRWANHDDGVSGLGWWRGTGAITGGPMGGLGVETICGAQRECRCTSVGYCGCLVKAIGVVC